MSYIDPDRLENAIAFVESQQLAAAEQQYLEEAVSSISAQYPDVDPEDLAANVAAFGGDFDATADALREYYANEQAEAAAPRTISDAVDAFMAEQRAG